MNDGLVFTTGVACFAKEWEEHHSETHRDDVISSVVLKRGLPPSLSRLDITGCWHILEKGVHALCNRGPTDPFPLFSLSYLKIGTCTALTKRHLTNVNPALLRQQLLNASGLPSLTQVHFIPNHANAGMDEHASHHLAATLDDIAAYGGDGDSDDYGGTGAEDYDGFGYDSDSSAISLW